MKTCPCGSGLDFSKCCEPFILGKQKAPSAEALMRSRYTAYSVQAIDYIINTCVKDGQQDIDVEQTSAWSKKSQWLGLKIVSVNKGGINDTEGSVEFKAEYILDGLKDVHHERALFKKIDGEWLYDSGEVVPTTVVRATPKIGRNDPCYCGSGKKYKHCCANK